MLADSSWEPISAGLARQGVVLEPGMVVVIRGTLDFYKPRAELGFLLSEIDVAAILGPARAATCCVARVARGRGSARTQPPTSRPVRAAAVGLVASPGHRRVTAIS